MHRRFIAVAALATMAACDRPTPPTEPAGLVPFNKTAAAKTNEWFDLTSTAFNMCVPESVDFEGKLHQVLTEETSGNTTTFKIHQNFARVVGIGLVTGAEYVLPDVVNVTGEFSNEPPFPFSQEFHRTANIISTGDIGNVRIHIIQTITFDGTNFIVEDRKFVIECRG